MLTMRECIRKADLMREELDAIFWVVLAIISIVMIIQLYVLYVNADTVECDGIWCKFTTVRSEIHTDCFENGKRINCSDSIKEQVMTLREELTS